MSGRFIRTTSQAGTVDCGVQLGRLAEAGDVVLLSGDLGAGKTQLTKGIAAGLEVVGAVTSPTFNILLVHEGRLPLYHFDLYRLDSPDQLEDLDYFATLEADGIAVVEWGDLFPEAEPVDGLLVTLRIEDDTRRRIEASPLGPRGERLRDAWLSACASVADADVEVAS